jgi:molybdopterin-guanine dinucleotide biosynthesis protein B
VLVEGFKHGRHRKLEVWRSVTGKPPLWPNDPAVVAVASDGPVPGCTLPVLDVDDAEAIATFVIGQVRQRGAAA